MITVNGKLHTPAQLRARAYMYVTDLIRTISTIDSPLTIPDLHDDIHNTLDLLYACQEVGITALTSSIHINRIGGIIEHWRSLMSAVDFEGDVNEIREWYSSVEVELGDQGL